MRHLKKFLLIGAALCLLGLVLLGIGETTQHESKKDIKPMPPLTSFSLRRI